MVCGKREGSGSEPVYLNVYDLTPINGYAYWLGLGVYHSGLQVHGVEYAFGAHEYGSTGIFEGEPKRCEGFRFRKTVVIGKTDMGAGEVKGLMEELGGEYRGNAYNLISKNCNHFCNDASLRLTGKPIPSWVNRLARIGFMCNCVLPVTLNSTRVRHHKIEEKQCEGDQKKQVSSSTTTTTTSDTANIKVPSASNSSPGPTLRRGRSRTRRPRPRPPPSPLTSTSS